MKYPVGGADFPEFGKSLEEVPERWRRGDGAAILTPQRNAKNLARRVEMQVANDWNLVPAARNISVRHSALEGAYASCTMRTPKDEPLAATATKLMAAIVNIYRSLHRGTVKVQGQKHPQQR